MAEMQLLLDLFNDAYFYVISSFFYNWIVPFGTEHGPA